MSRMISTIMLLIVVIVVGILFYRVMVGFFVPLFLAALLVVLFRPVHEWIGQRLGRPRTAAFATTATILLVVLLPTLLTVSIATAQATASLSRVNYNSVALAVERTRQQLGLEINNITPFLRMRQLIESFGDIDALANEKQARAAQDKFREFEQVLRTLRQDFAPLSEPQRAAFETVNEVLDQLRVDLALLVADGQPTPVAPSPAPVADAELDQPVPPADGQVADEQVADERLADDPLTDEPLEEALAEDTGPPPLVDFRSPAERFQRTLVRLDDATRELTDVLLGGALQAQLKQWANPTEEDITRWLQQGQDYLQSRLLMVTSATGEFLVQTLVGLAVLIISIYFFLVDGPSMVRTLMRLSPLDDRYEQKLLLEFDRTSRAVVLATVLSALVQGILATVGYYLAGLESIVLLFLLTTFMALIPFLGAAAVWVPCVLWLGLVQERWTAAILLAIYGALVVSAIDNVIKVFVLHGRSQLHPLLALLSVLGGVQVFGPIGILVGPMVVVFLQTTLEILNQELSLLQKAADAEGAVDGEAAAEMVASGDRKMPELAPPIRDSPPAAATRGRRNKKG